MNGGFTIIDPSQPIPDSISASLFVAGPPGPWSEQLEPLFRAARFEGTVFLWQQPHRSSAQADDPVVAWFENALRMSDGMLLWLGEGWERVPQLAELWGEWQRSLRVVVGVPSGAPPYRAYNLRVPVERSLEATVRHAVVMLGRGRTRLGIERRIPLCLWQSPGFVGWYKSMRSAGHRLEDAQLEWSFRSRAPGRPPLLWALRPAVRVAGENRTKNTEIVMGRSDISATVVYFPYESRALWDLHIVMVREYRSAVRNREGYALMLPSGSSPHSNERPCDPQITAQREVFEETGLDIDVNRFEYVYQGLRQVLATLASYRCHLYRVLLTKDEYVLLQRTIRQGLPHGINANERCYPEIMTVREAIINRTQVDWSQTGMILMGLSDLFGVQWEPAF